MSQTNVNIRIDEELKKEFDGLCNEMGMNMTTAFNIFARTVVRQRKIPFEVSLNTPNSNTIEAIREVKRMKKYPNKKLYSNFCELLEEVKADV